MSEELAYPAVPLDGLLRRAAERAPGRVAVRTERGDTTFGELDDSVQALAGTLARAVGGQGVAIGVANVLDPVFATLFYAVSRSGNVIVIVNPLAREATLAHIFSTAGIEVAFVTAEVARRLATMRGRLPRLRAVVVVDAGDSDADAVAVPGTVSLRDLAAGAAGAASPGAGTPALDRVACIQFTSGTTGAPKGVLLSHRNLVANAAQVAGVHGLGTDSVAVNHLPLYHLMHLNSGIYAGATQVLCRDPDPVASIVAAQRERATHYYGLPVRLARLAADPRLVTLPPVTGLRAVMSGGAALPPAVTVALRDRLGVPVTQGYGLAELSPLTHSDRPDRPKLGSVGPVVAGTGCRIVHVDTGEVLGPGQKGEVQVRGPQLMLGYLNQPDPPEIGPDGWFSTGDVGYEDDEGWLFLVDRIKDVFKVDNELVSPAEVEQVLRRHPQVADCVVVDYPDEFSGAVVWAGVVPRDPVAVDLLELTRSVNEHLPVHQHIRRIAVIEAVPRSAIGKVDRRALRERLRASAFRAHPPTGAGQVPAGTRSDTMVVFVNKVTVTGDIDEFWRIKNSLTEYMSAQAGYRSSRLLRSVRDDKVFIELAEWDSAEAHGRAVQSAGFQERVRGLGGLASVEPGLYETVPEVAGLNA